LYIDIGGETVLRSRDIVAIFDASILKQQKELTLAPNWRMLGHLVKSVVLTPTHVYGSPISCATLRKRLAKPQGLESET